jgi:hypothetical protein
MLKARLTSFNLYGSGKYFRTVINGIPKSINKHSKNLIVTINSDRFTIKDRENNQPQFEIFWTKPAPPKNVQYFQRDLKRLKLTLVPDTKIDRKYIGAYLKMVRELKTQSNIFSCQEEKRLLAYTPRLKELIPEKYNRQTLKNILLLIREHSLISIFNLLKILEKYGLKPENTAVYGKGDKCLNIDRVEASLLHRGYKVFTLGSFETHSPTKKTRDIRALPETAARVKKELEPFFNRAQKENKKIILFDDGGLLLTTVTSQFEDKLSLIAGAVESTKGGMHAIQAKANFPLTVINLADSNIKRLMGQDIAQSVIHNVRNMLPHLGFIGTNAVSIGYGLIGKHVALILKALGLNVYVCEVDKKKILAAEKAGFPVSPNAKEIFIRVKPKLVMGCTGLDALTYKNLISLPHDTYIATVSSNEIKQSYKDLNKHCRLKLISDFGRDYTLPGGNVIHILADGHSINLFHGEGAWHADYQPYLASMCASIMFIATNKIKPGQGLNLKLANRIEAEAKILEKFAATTVNL